ncbi:MAG: phosphoenolpyruvate carboxykinase (ATP) [Bacteroidales bacterium]|nr:phosphoenolpyruvate carboxykinase (ATP) [Bacteroidales bacterium]
MNSHPLKSKIDLLLKSKDHVLSNLRREKIIPHVLDNEEAFVSRQGALATWTSKESTGRSPRDTLIVQRAENKGTIDWDSPNNLPLDEEAFNMVLQDARKYLNSKENIFVTDRVIGADPGYALPVKTITDHALTALFTLNMFRPVPEEIEQSIFHNEDFYLISLPHNKLDKNRYDGILRKLEDGTTSDMIVAMDFERSMGIIIGSAYLGSVKKLMFTVMNYYLPRHGILPLHCSANESSEGDCALLLGLSGTGKTTLSADPSRALLGDDEHGWNDRGIANFENGCYAKMINIDPEKEPEIYDAVMHEDEYTQHGTIVENAMIYPNREFDFNDERLTPNSRASYPLDYLQNIKSSSVSGHPKTILFLTADAYGVLPPISKLNPDQAMLWFLMGYTSKVPGTETGITEPQATFSRFFGQPFMPANPDVYAEMLGEKLSRFNTNVYLINTGWTGGPYGKGKRIDITYTRKMIDAAFSGIIEKENFHHDELFHLDIPENCPGIPREMLFPGNTWDDGKAYDRQAQKLAQTFSHTFNKKYGNKIKANIKKQCPGK